MNPVLALVIAAVALLLIATVVFCRRGAAGLLGKLRSKPQPAQDPPPAPALENITFKQALQSDALASGLEELAKRQVEYALGLSSEEAVVQAVTLAETQDQMVVAYELSTGGTEPLQSGEAIIPLRREGGRFLAMLNDTRQRSAAVKNPPPRQAKAANAAALLAGVAHIIPGIGVLRDLKEIDRQLGALAKGRAIDQLAEIETIYNRLAEIFSRQDWMGRRCDLVASRDQLFKLRATWRRELEQIVDSAPSPRDTRAAEEFAKTGGIFFPPAFFVGKSLQAQRESEEESLFGHLTATADLMQRIRLSLLLDISIAQALGETETLAGVAMRNELEMWDGIVEKFQAKRKGIRTFETPGDLQTVEDALQGYVHMLASVAAKQDRKVNGRQPERAGASRLLCVDAQHDSATPGKVLARAEDAQQNALRRERQLQSSE